tara:strand:+ start:31 stop:315 length:285 start_codon:yes stop_codon:yes gene_type:complete
MNLDKYIDINFFIISFFIGIFMTYITVPYPEIVVKYPTPYKSIIYRDSADMCYMYEPQKVSCSGKKISDIPAQIINNNSINNKNAIEKIYKKKR